MLASHFKKIIFALSIIGMPFLLDAKNSIKESHLDKYIYNCVEFWFYPNHFPSPLKRLTKIITQEIKSSGNYNSEWNWDTYSYDTTYSMDYVEQMIRGITLEFIKNEAYTYAREIMSAAHAAKVAEYIYDQLFSVCANATELGQGIFASYIDVSLKNMVRDIYHHHSLDIVPGIVPVAQTFYPSTDCCICLESFYDVIRVFLVPCGHDVCVTCAKHWFFTDNKSNCPLCRQKVDKKALKNALAQAKSGTVPSAPPLYNY